MPGFTTPDPLAEQHYNESPYSYCGNNLVNRVDPTGLSYFQYGNAVIWDSSTDPTLDFNHEKYTNIGDTYSAEGSEGSGGSGEDGTWNYNDGNSGTFIKNTSAQYYVNEALYGMYCPQGQENSGTGGDNIVGDRTYSNIVGGASSNQNSSSGQNGGSSNETLLKISTVVGVV